MKNELEKKYFDGLREKFIRDIVELVKRHVTDQKILDPILNEVNEIGEKWLSGKLRDEPGYKKMIKDLQESQDKK